MRQYTDMNLVFWRTDMHKEVITEARWLEQRLRQRKTPCDLDSRQARVP